MSFDIDCVLRPGSRDIRVKVQSSGSLTAIVGRSGIGKTSVLNAVAGLLKPTAGRICVLSRTLFDSYIGIDLQPQERGAGYVFQDGRLFPHLRVIDNLAYGQRLAHPERKALSQEEVIDLLDIGDLLTQWPKTLSGGEARRVAIGRALLAGPRFLLLDEPLVSLDNRRAAQISALIERVRDEVRIPILLVSHSATEITRLANCVIDLEEQNQIA